MELQDRYFLTYAAAYIRGVLPEIFASYPQSLDELSEEDLENIFKLGKSNELKIHRFKKTMNLPRVQKVLGILKGLQPSHLLDIGTGRGVFLYPFLETFPYTSITCVDVLDYRVEALQAIHHGGIERLDAHLLDVKNLPFDDNTYDVATALEVLEHIPDVELAIQELCRVAGRFVVVSVPSKEDENPEHIHLFDEHRFRALFAQAGVLNLKFSYVLNHIVVVAKL